MRNHILTLGVMLLVPAAVMAEAIVHVKADQPSTVYVDNQLAGNTPLRLSHLAVGTHNLRVVNPISGVAREYAIYSPRTTAIDRDVNVIWNSVPVVAVAAPETTVVETVVAAPAVVYVERPAPVVVVRPYYHRHRRWHRW